MMSACSFRGWILRALALLSVLAGGVALPLESDAASVALPDSHVSSRATIHGCCPGDARHDLDAVYVSPYGLDGGPGTARLPVRTLSRALKEAAREGRAAVYLPGASMRSRTPFSW